MRPADYGVLSELSERDGAAKTIVMAAALRRFARLKPATRIKALQREAAA